MKIILTMCPRFSGQDINPLKDLRVYYGLDPTSIRVGVIRIIDSQSKSSLYYDSAGKTNFKSLNKSQTPYRY